MTALVLLVNTSLAALLDVLTLPLRSLDQIWSLAALSALAGPAAVAVYGKASDQERIRAVHRRIQGALIGMRLYRSSTGAFFRLQATLLASVLSHLRLTLAPAAVLALPLALLLLQFQGRYGVRPLRVGESAVVTARTLDEGSVSRLSGLSLAAGEGLSVETGAVRIPSRGEAAWRVRALEEGEHSLTVRTADGEASMRVVVGRGGKLLAPVSTGEGPLALLLNPGGAPLDPGSGFASVRVHYPEAELSVFGVRVHWLAVFLAVSLAAGYGLRGRLGVEL